MDTCTTFPELFEEIKAAKSIQVVCNGNYELTRNLFHLLRRTDMRFGEIHTPIVEDTTFNHIMKLSCHFAWDLREFFSSALDETPADQCLAFVVTIKLTDAERKNAEQKFGKMIYVQDAYGVNHNTNCDMLITSRNGEAFVSSKCRTNKRCEIETRDTYLEKYKSYNIETILRAIFAISSGQSVYFDDDCKIYQKLIIKSAFLRRCNLYWLVFSSIFPIKDLVWLMMQTVVDDFERNALLR